MAPPPAQPPVERYDLVVLGGGSAGEYVGNGMASAGHRVAVVEANRVGGECPYVSCMPSKALLREAAARREGGRPGTGKAAWGRAIAHRDLVTAGRDDADAAAGLARSGAVLVRGWGRVSAPGEVTVDLKGGGRQVLAYTDLLLSPGSRPTLPPLEGLADVPTWTSDQALSSDELPARLIVLGGGPVGCELATVYAAYGVQVTLVEAADRLVAHEDPEIGAALAEVLGADGVELRLGVAAERVQAGEGGLRLTLAGGDRLDADRLLVATGRAPALDGLGLPALGLDEDRIQVDARCRVLGTDHVFAAGDITGEAPYTHTANYHARLIIDELSGRGRDADLRAIPRAVYTDPPLAAVGLTAAEAREAGRQILTETMDLAETARAVTEGEGKLGPKGRHGGVVVLHADRESGHLVGAAAVGTAADSWIGEAQLAIRARVPVQVLADLVHPFPAWSEVYGPAYRALADKLARHPAS